MTIELTNFLTNLKSNISQKILDGSNINEIANTYNLKIRYFKNVEKFHQNNQEDSFKDEIIRQGFTSNIDFVSDLIDYGDQKSFILNVDNVYPSKPKEYEIIYEKVIKDWLLNKKKDFIDNDFSNNLENQNYLEKLSRKNIYIFIFTRYLYQNFLYKFFFTKEFNSPRICDEQNMEQ